MQTQLEQIFGPRLYQLEAIKDEKTGISGLKIVNMQNGEEVILPAITDLTGAGIFEAALEEVLGREEILVDLYCNHGRPKVTQYAFDRICAAHASSGYHY